MLNGRHLLDSGPVLQDVNFSQHVDDERSCTAEEHLLDKADLTETMEETDDLT